MRLALPVAITLKNVTNVSQWVEATPV